MLILCIVDEFLGTFSAGCLPPTLTGTPTQYFSLSLKTKEKRSVFNTLSFLNRAGDMCISTWRVSHLPYSNTPLNAQDAFLEHEALNETALNGVIITLCKGG